MNDLMRPGLYGAYHRIVPLRRAAATQEPSPKYDVVGPVCESTDCFGVQRALPGVQTGDCVALLDAGAYSFALA